MAVTEQDRDALSAYLDGELDDAALQRLEARLHTDREIRAEYVTLRQTWGLLDYLPRAAPSADFTSRTLQRLAVETQALPRPSWTDKLRRLPWRGLSWAGAVLVALLVGHMLGARFSGPAESASDDEALVRQLRVIKQWPVYQHAEDIDFVRQLDQPDLFGDDSGS